jgi:hypothetical protein
VTVEPGNEPFAQARAAAMFVATFRSVPNFSVFTE